MSPATGGFDRAITIAAADGAQDRADFLGLMAEYLQWANAAGQEALGPEFGFDEARLLAKIEAQYADFTPPMGRLFLARADGEAAGCGALKPLMADTGEVKRFYVRPAFRGRGIGRRLLAAIIEAGRAAPYARLRLDSPNFMAAAHRVYRAAGFKEIAPYPESGLEAWEQARSVFMELSLDEGRP